MIFNKKKKKHLRKVDFVEYSIPSFVKAFPFAGIPYQPLQNIDFILTLSRRASRDRSSDWLNAIDTCFFLFCSVGFLEGCKKGKLPNEEKILIDARHPDDCTKWLCKSLEAPANRIRTFVAFNFSLAVGVAVEVGVGERIALKTMEVIVVMMVTAMMMVVMVMMAMAMVLVREQWVGYKCCGHSLLVYFDDQANWCEYGIGNFMAIGGSWRKRSE